MSHDFDWLVQIHRDTQLGSFSERRHLQVNARNSSNKRYC